MKKFTMFACVALALVLAVNGFARDEAPRFAIPGNGNVLHGGNPAYAKAAGDTITLMGPASFVPTPAYIGDMEGTVPPGMRLPAGFTTIDITQPTVAHWSNVSLNADSLAFYLPAGAPYGNNAWCGDYIAACGAADSAWGYANSWHETLQWTHAIPFPADITTINVSGVMWHDTELGWDYIYLSYITGNVLGYNNTPFTFISGRGSETISETITYNPGDYNPGNTVKVAFRFLADSAASDQDCFAAGTGAMNLDDLVVSLTNGTHTYGTTDDFNAGLGANWVPTIPDGVGDFAQIWTDLVVLDPCNANFTKQCAFIDDGLIVPGTGGTQGQSWQYGPGGYIVNTEGGLAGPLNHIHNSIESPAMTWPNQSYDGIVYLADTYAHEDLSALAPGIFYTWSIRSADTDGSAHGGIPQVLADQPWQDNNYVYYSGSTARWIRLNNDCSSFMNPGRDVVQIQLAVYELGWVWGWNGADGYPAPYVDNTKLQLYEFLGPALTTREVDIAQDNWPTRNTIDLLDLGSHSVRFDAAENVSPATHNQIDPGDSIQIDVVPVRSGSSLTGPPVLKYTFAKRNGLFDTWRTSTEGLSLSGSVAGYPATDGTTVVADRWAFDLPDSNFLFPGDILHYYVEATDDQAGSIQTTTIPGDLTGYGDASDPLAYNTSWIVHCLPSIRSDGFSGYLQPGMLFWNDFGGRGAEAEWYGALSNLGYKYGEDYDVYYTNNPSSGLGNGIGSRASHLTLLGDAVNGMPGYADMLYSAGNLSTSTIGNGDLTFGTSDDVTVLRNWLDEPNKDIFLCGDNLFNDLAQSGSNTLAFLGTYCGLTLTSSDVRPLIAGQTTPLILDIAGDNTIQNIGSWIAYGSCQSINTFDAIELTGGSVRSAEFANPAGTGGSYPFAALATNQLPAGGRVVSQPYGFHYLYDDIKAPPAPLTARAQVLKDILSLFGATGSNPLDVSPVPDAGVFSSTNYPNPFNPTTKIEFNMPKRGHLSLKVFNVRGELVRTLINEVRDAGSDHIMWDGTSNSGATVASGVYFYEARYGDEVQVKKMALVK